MFRRNISGRRREIGYYQVGQQYSPLPAPWLALPLTTAF